ncbi:MAG: Hsp20/alpha crystallin family protein, partial [Rubrobacter sp.]|nr:Hsp20/alpha crystallin family protein [Rubrobacter sp.]
GGLARRQSGQQRGQHLTEWAPAVDVLQRDGDLVVRAELPGVRPEDVNITLQDNVLTISGERQEEQEERRGGYYVKERRRGTFSRSMTLPEGVSEDSIRARYEHGVLEVSIQGAAAVREPRRIQVESAGGESAGTHSIGTERPGEGIGLGSPGSAGTQNMGTERPGEGGGPASSGDARSEGPGGPVR